MYMKWVLSSDSTVYNEVPFDTASGKFLINNLVGSPNQTRAAETIYSLFIYHKDCIFPQDTTAYIVGASFMTPPVTDPRNGV